MLTAISAGEYVDSEYLRIINELRRFGLSPSGNKSTDASRLAQAKTELVNKLQKREQINNAERLGVQVMEPVDESANAVKAEMEEQRIGAMNIAQLNRLYFGI